MASNGNRSADVLGNEHCDVVIEPGLGAAVVPEHEHLDVVMGLSVGSRCTISEKAKTCKVPQRMIHMTKDLRNCETIKYCWKRIWPSPQIYLTCGIDTLPHTRAPCVTHEAPSSSDGIETLKIDQLNAQWIKADLTQERHVSHMKRSHVRMASTH